MSIRHDDVNDTCISDLFIFIPKKYFTPFNQWNGLLSNANRMLHHHSVQELIRNGLSLNDFEYVTDRTYIANTMQLTNPLYAINCRLEGPTFVNGYSNRRYNKETHTVVDL
jgi:hypothetical protein